MEEGCLTEVMVTILLCVRKYQGFNFGLGSHSFGT